MPDPATTRLSLHAVAELLVAGPQYAVSKRIRLRATPGGFGTTASPEIRVDGLTLNVGNRSIALQGRTISDIAQDAGLTPRPLDDVYSGGSGLGVDHRLAINPGHALEIAEAFRVGAQALSAFAPTAEQALWPEHFDLAITLDEVNYGVSPGDSFLGFPYAYVGPWSPGDLSGPFWNAPFGAARVLSEMADLRAFFAEGQALAN